jgi:hypothetical protein
VTITGLNKKGTRIFFPMGLDSQITPDLARRADDFLTWLHPPRDSGKKFDPSGKSLACLHDQAPALCAIRCAR